ncbi:SRPBCC family protein [Paenibacillus hamazuiensis]|uniref:SRPBCC family protein n=1 Tax=Paenibacillus hamazuiensis TaxID=2936508 RepID=UPI00200D165E|nr:SRPBCC family protein [Paenibacillus hamazuiensis]
MMKSGLNNEDRSTIASVEGRELVVTRVFNAPRELVFKTWTDPEHLPHWWGPKGFTITTHEIDVRPGGVWRYIMHGPDGVDYDNKIVYTEVASPERLVYAHGGGDDDQEEPFHVTVTFAGQDGRTELTMRMVFKSAEELEKVVKEHGAIEGAKSTLDRLEEQLQKQLNR